VWSWAEAGSSGVAVEELCIGPPLTAGTNRAFQTKLEGVLFDIGAKYDYSGCTKRRSDEQDNPTRRFRLQHQQPFQNYPSGDRLGLCLLARSVAGSCTPRCWHILASPELPFEKLIRGDDPKSVSTADVSRPAVHWKFL